MKVLVVGGAGYVGTILRPALDKEHQCVHFDLSPVPGAQERTIIGDVTDPGEARNVSGLVRKKYGLSVPVSKPSEPLTPGEQATFELIPVA